LPDGESEKFFSRGLDSQIAKQPVGQIAWSCFGLQLEITGASERRSPGESDADQRRMAVLGDGER